MARERTDRGYAGRLLEVVMTDLLVRHGSALVRLLLARPDVTTLGEADIRLRSAGPGARSVWLDALLVCRDGAGRFLLDIEIKTGAVRARDRRQLASQVTKLDEKTRPGEEHAGLPFEVVLARTGSRPKAHRESYERQRGLTGLACRWQVFRFQDRTADWYARLAPVPLSVLCPLGRGFSPALYGVALERILAVRSHRRRHKLLAWLGPLADVSQPGHHEEIKRMRNHRLSKADKEEQDLVWRVHATLLGTKRLERMIKAGEKRGLKLGEERGEKRGEKRGETRGKQEALIALLEHRFGAVPESVVQRIRAIRSSDRLRELLGRALEVRRAASLFR